MSAFTESININIQLIGTTSSGLQSIILRYCDNIFNPQIQYSEVLEFRNKTMIQDDKRYNIILWHDFGFDYFDEQDIQKRLKYVDGIVFIYDITNRDSFNDNYKRFLRMSRIQSNLPQIIPIMLIGNKNDLYSNRSVSFQEAQDISQSLGFYFFETSAIHSNSISFAFNTFLQDIILTK